MNFCYNYFFCKNRPVIGLLFILFILCNCKLRASEAGDKDSVLSGYSIHLKKQEIPQMTKEELTRFIDQVFDMDSIPVDIINEINTAIAAIDNSNKNIARNKPERKETLSPLEKELREKERLEELNEQIRKSYCKVDYIDSKKQTIVLLEKNAVPTKLINVPQSQIMEAFLTEKKFMEGNNDSYVKEITGIHPPYPKNIVYEIEKKQVLLNDGVSEKKDIQYTLSDAYYFYDSKSLDYFSSKNFLIPSPSPTQYIISDELKKNDEQSLSISINTKSPELSTKEVNEQGLQEIPLANLKVQPNNNVVDYIEKEQKSILENTTSFKLIEKLKEPIPTENLYTSAGNTNPYLLTTPSETNTLEPLELLDLGAEIIPTSQRNMVNCNSAVKTTIKDSLYNSHLKNSCYESICNIEAKDIEGIQSLTEKPSSDYYLTWTTDKLFPPEDKLNLKMDTIITLSVINEHNSRYTHPFDGVITSGFGWRDSSMHNGIDIDLRRGDKVVAAFDGMVRISNYSGGYGRVVIIRHYNGLETVYAHLSKLLVKPGQVVYSGEVIGLGGSTGHSTGSHLHFEFRFKGVPINPKYLISLSDKTLLSNEFSVKNTKYGLAVFPKDAKYYTVVKGDTVFEIAKRFGTSTKSIKELNQINSTWARLKSGRQISIEQ